MLGVFQLQYSPLVNVCIIVHYENCWVVKIKLGSKIKKRIRGSIQVTVQPLAIILTTALWA